MESREDFTSEDDAIFPIYIHQGGELYNFCPAKATWDASLISLYQELVLIGEMRQFPNGKCIEDQDGWLVELTSWFLPTYDLMKFVKKADMIVGSNGDKKPNAPTKPPRRR